MPVKMPVIEFDAVVDGVMRHVVIDQNKFFSPVEIENMRFKALLDLQKVEQHMEEEMKQRMAENLYHSSN